jgi:gliding motility-associated-like protein
MFKRLQHIIVLLILLCSFTTAAAQVAMPDTVCVGTARLYHVNDATIPSTYTWKIEGATQTATRNEINITWNTAGVFLLTVQEHPATGCDGDIRSGLVYVNPAPAANAGRDTIICFGETIRLNGSGGAPYQWTPSTYLSNTNTANPIVSIPAAGNYNYVLNISNGNACKSSAGDTVMITMLPQATVFAGNDTSIASNQPLQLNAIDVNNSGFINYTWSPPSGLNNPFVKNPVAVLNNDITYLVTAHTLQECEASDAINIKVFTVAEMDVPNAFSPNGDQLNEPFKPILKGIKELKHFSIFNRYGQLMFTTSKQGEGWDGTFNGKPQQIGAYVWIVEAVGYNSRVFTKKGTVVLIR